MTTIQQKRGTAANWLSKDPVLADGEIGLESDTAKIKFGDGVSVWSVLPYATSGSGGSGTVTSVDITLPTGLSVTGNPITTSGTLAVTFSAGYSIPTTTSQGNWDTAYTDRLKWDGGSTGLTASTGRTSLGATTVGSNLFTLTNPSAITFLRVNADNTVSTLDAATFRTAIGAGTSSTTGTVTTVSVASANGFAGTVANATTTPAITLTTTITGLLSGNGTAISAASAGYGDTTNPYGSKTANYFLAGPTSGASAAPAFRTLNYQDFSTINTPSVAGQIPYYTLAGNGVAWSSFYIGATAVSSTSGATLTLRSGTASAGTAPLVFGTTSPAILTTPVIGTVENDVRVFYGTPNVGTATTGSTVTGRGLIPTSMFYVVNSDATIITASSTTVTGNVMNAKGAWLLSNTTYEIEFVWYTEVAFTGGSTGSNFNLVMNFPTGASSWLSLQYTSPSSHTAQSTTVAWQAFTDVAGTVTGSPATIQSSLSSASTYYNRYILKGTVSTGATAGYFNPQHAVTAAAGATITVKVKAGSFAKVTPVGSSAADINIGPWS